MKSPVAAATLGDWTDVALALSTAQPARGVDVPDLPPQYLDIIRPVPRAPAAGLLQKGRADELRTMGAMESLEDKDAGIPMEAAEAGVAQGLLAATFTAPRRESIDSSGTARRAFLSTFPLKAELTRLAAPKLDERTVLTAKAVKIGRA